MKLKKFSLRVFNQISIAHPQNKETIRYLKKLGVRNIDYIGNLKFFEDKKIVNKKFDKRIKINLKNTKHVLLQVLIQVKKYLQHKLIFY